MSRSQLSRTPENFPRMKHRAAGRLARKQALQAAPSIFKSIGEALDRVVAGFKAMAKAFASIVALPSVQTDFAIPRTATQHSLPQTAFLGGKP